MKISFVISTVMLKYTIKVIMPGRECDMACTFAGLNNEEKNIAINTNFENE